MDCPNCQTINSEQAKFCKECGTRLAHACPNCGHEYPPGSKFCENCGHYLADPQMPSTAEADGQPSLLHRYIPKELAAKLEAARSSRAMEGERRVVTMLFCDVKGSTAAAEQLDPEDWRGIMNEAFELMIHPVYKYEGTVARLMGDGILVFFGAPIAHEDDPQRAVLTGLDIVSGMQIYREEVKSEWAIDFNVRVGINTGLVVVGSVGSDLRMEYTAMGEAINLAARMEQIAAPGTVQISEETFKLVSPFFRVRDLGGLSVKGKSEPVTSYQVLGRKEVPESLRGIAGMETPFVGRDQEFDILQEVVENLKRGMGGIVGLLGEAGLGKSRLITELRVGAQHVAHFQWYETASHSYEGDQPYGFFRRLIRRVIGAKPGDQIHEMRVKIGIVVDEFPPEEQALSRRVFESLFGLPGAAGEPPLEGETFKSMLFSVMNSLWSHRASQNPVVLTCDDLHWTDPASVDLLRHLLPLTDQVPLLLLFAMRTDRNTPGWELKQVAETDFPHRYTEINLQPLSSSASSEMVDNLLQISNLPTDLQEIILEKSEGNPFFVEEVVRTLIDTGIVVRDERGSHWMATAEYPDIDIPSSVQTLLTARIDRLAEDARQTLQLASVIGRSFYYRVLARIAERVENLDAHLVTLQRTELIREASRIPELEYIFRHALTQEAAYKTVLRKQRRAYHLLVGEAIETLFPDQVDEMAQTLVNHFYQGGDNYKTFEYATRAGDSAFRLHALSEAVEHYLRAIQAANALGADGVTTTQLIHLYTRLGRAYEILIQFDKAEETYKKLLNLSNERADQALKLAYHLSLGQVYAWFTPLHNPKEAISNSDQALALAEELGDRHGESKAHWVSLLVNRFVKGDLDTAAHHGEVSISIARDLEWDEQLAFSLNDLSLVNFDRGRLQRAWVLREEARVLWQKMSNLSMLIDNLTVSGMIITLFGDFQLVHELTSEGLQLSHSVGNMWNKPALLWVLGLVYTEWGEFGKAVQALDEAWAVAEDSNSETHFSMSLMGSLPVYYELGLIEKGLEICKRGLALEEDPWMKSMGTIDYIHAMQALFYLAGGRLDSAREILDILPVSSPKERYGFADLVHILILCELAIASGDYDQVFQGVGKQIPKLEEEGVKLVLAHGFYYMGQAFLAKGDMPEANTHFSRAGEIAEAIGSRRILWRILAAIADLAEREGNHSKAASHRDQVKEHFSFIAKNAGSNEYKASFLARQDIAQVMEKLNQEIT